MDWIEVTARTVDDAKELALDRLGVVEDELEFEVVDEARKGLFGIGRSDARIRARVKPISREKPSDRKRRAPSQRALAALGPGRQRSQSGGGGRSGGGQAAVGPGGRPADKPEMARPRSDADGGARARITPRRRSQSTPRAAGQVRAGAAGVVEVEAAEAALVPRPPVRSR